jgi:nitroimidazol reductase NimA-like FMN-containing flavoprotein (pyridoxamine 5'-phosphate oxidase superfamily)
MLGKLSEKEIKEVLLHNFLGHIGCHDDGKTYVVPVNYVYDGTYIIAHSVMGMKIQMMRNNPQVCFEVDEIKDYANWKSVIVWGEYQEVTDVTERYHALTRFVERTLHTKISETAVPPEFTEKYVAPKYPQNAKPVIYRIVMLESSGRYEKDGGF